MRLSDFDYDLPDALVAQEPAARREDARLLVASRGRPDDAPEHARVSDLVERLAPGDLVVVNDTRVRRARIVAHRSTGGRVECLLVERVEPGVGDGAGDAGGSCERDDARSVWRALCRPAAKLRPGEVLDAGGARLVALERERRPDGEVDLFWRVELLDADGTVPADDEALIERIGRIPLPPYVQRDARDEDERRYQTVYADRPGAVAAPTAGLHLSDGLLAELAARGVERTSVTLHVGPGTFRPVEVDDPREHPMHAERYEVTEGARAAIEACRARGGRVVAVGTTVVRTLCAARGADGLPKVGRGSTDLFLFPGAADTGRLDAIDALLTNFHLPRSTLLMLVAAWLGTERTLELYREAVAREYRFYSYGDAMIVLP